MPTLLDSRQHADAQIEPASTTAERSPGWAKRTIVRSLILFAAINLTLWTIDKDKQSTDVWNGTGSIDLAVDAFNSAKQAPGVVLLGSSLVMYPFWTMDRDRYGQIPDILHHHESKVLSRELRDAGFPNSSVTSLAIFGQMVSDAYIYVNEYLKGSKRPEYLIYGIAPRDFSDSDLAGPMSTNTFKRLISLNNFAQYADLYLPGLQDRVDFLASRTCFFYNKRWRLQHEFEKGLNKIYEAAGIEAPAAPAGSDTQAGFMLSGNKEERWSNSEREYARRYKNIAERDLSVQTGFLKRLLDVCRQRGIKVVLINMPLTADNRRLLPPGFYASFRQNIAGISNRPGVKLVDLGESGEFGRGDFWDTVHLEHGGGYKMLKHVMSALKQLRHQL